MSIEIFKKQKAKAKILKNEPYSIRIAKLIKLENWILNHRLAIQQAVFNDFKKPESEADLSEILPVVLEIRKAKKNLKYWVKPKNLASGPLFLGTSASIVYEPKGICLIISPWNYPFNLTIGPLISAIAAGNTVFIKPSEFTPHTSALINQMIVELFSPDEITVFEGDSTVSSELLKLPFDHIFFTGSPKVGKIIMEAAAKNLASVTLELGGKSPVIVDKSANLKDVAEKIAWGKWLNAGQTCVAPDYVFVHETIKDDFISTLKLSADKIYGKKGNYTAIVNQSHFKRLESLEKDAVAQGGKIEWGGDKSAETNYIMPLVISGSLTNTELLDQEIFGPILPVLTYNVIDEVIEYINVKPKPLALYVFGNTKVIEHVLKNTSSGTFVANDCVLQFGHPELPFGGVNNSGIGKSHGHFGFVAFSNEKSVLRQRIGLTMAKTLYPPFNGMKKSILDFMIRYL